MKMKSRTSTRKIQRIQVGARMEKTIVKVLKGLAEYLDLSLGDLIEGVALHAFEGKTPFSPATLKQVKRLKAVYGMTVTAADSHRLVEESHARRRVG